MMEIELPNLKNDIIRFHDYYGRKDNNFYIENKNNIQNINKKFINKFTKSKTLHFYKEKILFIKFQKNSCLSKNEILQLNKYSFLFLFSENAKLKVNLQKENSFKTTTVKLFI